MEIFVAMETKEKGRWRPVYVGNPAVCWEIKEIFKKNKVKLGEDLDWALGSGRSKDKIISTLKNLEKTESGNKRNIIRRIIRDLSRDNFKSIWTGHWLNLKKDQELFKLLGDIENESRGSKRRIPPIRAKDGIPEDTSELIGSVFRNTHFRKIKHLDLDSIKNYRYYDKLSKRNKETILNEVIPKLDRVKKDDVRLVYGFA